MTEQFDIQTSNSNSTNSRIVESVNIARLTLSLTAFHDSFNFATTADQSKLIVHI